MNVVVIEEALARTPADLHGRLARILGFPAHYGANLSALSDCLGDIDEPTRIRVIRAPAGARVGWLDGFCRVIGRCARENGLLEFSVEHCCYDPAPAAMGPSAAEALGRIERRLDLLQAPQPVTSAGGDRATARNLATGADGDRFECGACGCRVTDWLEESRMLLDGFRYCPQCGREVSNPGGSESMSWVGELV